MKWWLSRGDDVWRGVVDGAELSARFVYDDGTHWGVYVADPRKLLRRHHPNVLWDHEARGGADILEPGLPTSISAPLVVAMEARAQSSPTRDQQRVIDLVADAVSSNPGWISGRRLRARFESQDPDRVQARLIDPLCPRYLERFTGTPAQGESYALTAPGLLASQRSAQAKRIVSSCVTLLSRLWDSNPDTLSFEWSELAQEGGWEEEDLPFVRHTLRAFQLARWNQGARFGIPPDFEHVRRLTGFDDFLRYVRDDTKTRPWPTAPRKSDEELAATDSSEIDLEVPAVAGPPTIFYSWQSDLPNKTNRTLIEEALRRAVRQLHREGVVTVEPVVDRDTQGLTGSPDIGTSILSKIANATVVVADVSIIGVAADRPTPNPNVVFELGYALHTLEWPRVITVMNTAFGPVEQLPFDLRQKRAVTYSMREDETPGAAREELVRKLTAALRPLLEA